MIMRSALAVAAVLAFSTPALAQEAVQPTAPQAPARQPTAEDIAFDQAAQAFRGRMQTMVGEIQTMLSDASTNGAQKRANTDTILAAYSPEIDAFANQLQAYLVGAQSRATDPQEQAAIASALQEGPASVRGIPNEIRQNVAAAIAREEAAAAAAAQSGQPATVGEGAVAGTLPVQ
jgi:hypothetical protein